MFLLVLDFVHSLVLGLRFYDVQIIFDNINKHQVVVRIIIFCSYNLGLEELDYLFYAGKIETVGLLSVIWN
jgi:hypothetical protein